MNEGVSQALKYAALLDVKSKVNLKRLLMTECNLHTIIRLPSSVFVPYTSISTNLLFFDKTGKTEEVWFYRMDMPEGRKHFNKTHPITRGDTREAYSTNVK